MIQRVTYKSTEANYKLDPKLVINVVENLMSYVHDATIKAINDNAGITINSPATNLMKVNGKLELITEAIYEKGFLRGFTLADLVLKNKELTFQIYAHDKVAIEPSGLYEIAKKYELTK